MSDFQKAVSALRSVGIGVTVENVGAYQIAKIKGNRISGSFTNENEVERIKIPIREEKQNKPTES